ncbi:MAG: hypothetical protein ACRD5Z_16520, partial [Bryobacteraceae bacterium]
VYYPFQGYSPLALRIGNLSLSSRGVGTIRTTYYFALQRPTGNVTQKEPIKCVKGTYGQRDKK